MVYPRFGGENGGVLSMRMQVILDSSFARPGSAPIWGGKKVEFRDWTSGNQIVEHSSDNETVLGSSRKLWGAAEHLIEGSEKRICRLSLEF